MQVAYLIFCHQNYMAGSIGLDKSGYQVNTFLISRRKHMLWVLIRSASAENLHCGYSLEVPQRGASNEYPQHMFSSRNEALLMSTHNICFRREIRKIQLLFG